jgi:hypothetical protein
MDLDQIEKIAKETSVDASQMPVDPNASKLSTDQLSSAKRATQEPSVQDAVRRVLQQHRDGNRTNAAKTDQEPVDANALSDSQPEGDDEQDDSIEESQEDELENTSQALVEDKDKDKDKDKDEQTLSEEEQAAVDEKSAADADAKVKAKEAAEADAKLTQEERDAKLPFNKHPRFQELLNTTKAQAHRLGEFQKEIDWCKQNGITPNLRKQAMDLAALSVKDPEAFYKLVGQMQGEYEVNAGIRLPDDLAKKVSDGKLDEEDAREIAKLRVERNGLDRSVKTAAQQQEEARQSQITEGLNTIGTVLAKNDPLFRPKASPNAANGIWEYSLNSFLLMQAQSPARNGLEAQQQFKQCYDEVKRTFSTLYPQKTARRLPSRSASGFTPTVRPKEPTSAVDAVNSVLKSRGIQIRASRNGEE